MDLKVFVFDNIVIPYRYLLYMATSRTKKFIPKQRSRKSRLRTQRLIENNNTILKRYAGEINSNKLLDC